jgi:hypothetical protein
MRVRCLNDELTEEQRKIFKVSPLFRTKYQISIGKEYLVLGLTFVVDSPIESKTVLLQVVNDAGGCSFIPSVLFELSDGRCSSFWQARFYEDGAVTLWPSEFYEPYFHDKLSDHDPEIRKLWELVLKKMQAEFADWAGDFIKPGRQPS